MTRDFVADLLGGILLAILAYLFLVALFAMGPA